MIGSDPPTRAAIALRQLRPWGPVVGPAVAAALIAGGAAMLVVRVPAAPADTTGVSVTTEHASGVHGTESTALSGSQPSPASTKPIGSQGPRVLVHVAGEVLQPGVVELPPDARVADAIAAAGGTRSAAASASLNLARFVKDGERIDVRPISDTNTSATDANSDVGVNINTATVEQLDALTGVGPSTATKIVDHREAHGPFITHDDLLAVSGIGPATLDRFRDQLAPM